MGVLHLCDKKRHFTCYLFPLTALSASTTNPGPGFAHSTIASSGLLVWSVTAARERRLPVSTNYSGRRYGHLSTVPGLPTLDRPTPRPRLWRGIISWMLRLRLWITGPGPTHRN